MSVLESMLNAVQPVDTLRHVALLILPVVRLPRGSRNVLTRAILEHVVKSVSADHYEKIGKCMSLPAVQGCMRKHGLTVTGRKADLLHRAYLHDEVAGVAQRAPEAEDVPPEQLVLHGSIVPRNKKMGRTWATITT